MQRAIRRTLITGTVIAIVGPALGLLGTVLGMVRSFDTLGTNGVASPQALAGGIGTSMVSSAVGIGVGILGAVIVVVGLVLWLNTRRSPPPLRGPGR